MDERRPQSTLPALFTVISLSKHAHRSYDKIAFLPDTNVSEYLTFQHITLFTLVVSEDKE